MNKSVLMSIQPYWGFLIIARLMGWDIPQHKTVEVRKDCPKDNAWNNVVHIYCSKSKKSFNRIPKEYQPLMERFLGKVVGEFACLRLEKFAVGSLRCDDIEGLACLSYSEMINYFYKPEELDGKTAKEGFGWHIDALQVYDKPKELGEFRRECKQYGAENPLCDDCRYFDCCRAVDYDESDCVVDGLMPLTRAPQSWCYVEKLND